MWANEQYLEQLNLGDAVATQGVQLITRLLDLKSDKINVPGAGGLTPLHRACGRGSLELAQLLISRGADLEKETEAGETPIHYACKRGNSLVIDLLVKAGANVDKTDNQGKTVLHQAAQGGSVYALLYLESAAPHLDMNQCDKSGRSLLHYACLQGHKDVVRFLLRRSRCSVDLVDDKGNTCLHLVASTTRDDIAWILIMDGGGFKLLSLKNEEEQTPADIAGKLSTTDSRYRSIRGFFRVCHMVSSPTQLTSQTHGIRLFLLLGPFMVFGAGVCAAKYFPKWDTFIFCVAVVASLINVRMQGHRTMDAARLPNPIFLGAYAAGVAHSIICFYYDVLPYVRYTWIPKVAIVFIPLHFLVYFSLLFGDPGSVSPGEDAKGRQSSDNFCDTLRQGALSLREGYLNTDVFCPFCEAAMKSPNIKHCKLCRRCYADLDHHCLFLMTCIARRNHLRFIWLIILSVFGIVLFLWSIYLKFRIVCAIDLTPVAFTVCVMQRSPWSAAAAFFNSGSLIWGLYMITYSIRAISEGGTVYFRASRSSRPSYLTRIMNVICFLTLGRWYKRAEQTDACGGHGHSHGV